MNDSTRLEFASLREKLAAKSAALSRRMAEFLRKALSAEAGPLTDSLAFLDAYCQSVLKGAKSDKLEMEPLDERPANSTFPIDRLVDGFGLSPTELDLVLLAGLPHEHEGFASLFRSLHPQGKPFPSVGLAAQLFWQTEETRDNVRKILEEGQATRVGILQLDRDEPFFESTLRIMDSLWSCLKGIDAWPVPIERTDAPVAMHGLHEWLDEPRLSRARQSLAGWETCTILVTADEEENAFQRASVLAHRSGIKTARIRWPLQPIPDLEKKIRVFSVAHRAVPVLLLRPGEMAKPVPVPPCDGPGPLIVCARTGTAEIRGSRPIVHVTCDRLTPSAQRTMWSRVLPGLAGRAPELASRFPLEPWVAQEVSIDLRLIEELDNRKTDVEDVAETVRARTTSALAAGVKLVRPTARWEQLVLPDPCTRKLKEILHRLQFQAKVLDDWKFLDGRPGSRGVRALFSGPPGTGKTFSAEVLANMLHVDLLVIDLSRVVSKWIGETEKNLAEIFDTGERTRAVLLFDEADSLFAKRFEIADSRDRYANLETAYLLMRLERFEGLAVLSTNFRKNIDHAFFRRLEFIVDFEEPKQKERLELWRSYLPSRAPLAKEISLAELAALYPMVGGTIRNAAVAAAFLAASERSPITQDHFIQAIQREYEKNGKAFPGLPAGLEV